MREQNILCYFYGRFAQQLSVDEEKMNELEVARGRVFKGDLRELDTPILIPLPHSTCYLYPIKNNQQHALPTNIQAFLYELISEERGNYLDHLHVIDRTEKDQHWGSVLDLRYYHDNLLMVIDSVCIRLQGGGIRDRQE